MAENFVEEDGGGAAGENGGAVERLSDGSFAQGLETLAEIANGGCENGLRGKAINGFSLEGLFAKEVHAVNGAGDGDCDDSRLQMGCDDLRSLGGGEIVGLILHGKKNHVLVHVRVVAEDARQFPHPLLPCGVVNDDARSDGADVILGGLLAEIGRSVLFFGADFGFGLDAKVVVESIAVAGIGGQPEGTRKGRTVVAKRELEAVDGRAAMRAVGVVEFGIADAHLYVGRARAARRTLSKCAVERANGDVIRVANRVAEKVGRQWLVGGSGRCSIRDRDRRGRRR
jgi:hypothetical protein